MLRAVGSGWQAPQGSLNAADALSLGASLDDARRELLACLDEAYASTVTEMLDEWETVYALPVVAGLSLAERRARLVAFVRAAFAGTPQSIERAVAAYAGSASINEAPPNGVYVFLFAVVVPIAIVQQPAKAAQVRAIVDRMKPAHTNYTIANAIGFYCDGYLDTYLDTTALGA
jgi:hypothetical protein